MDKRLFIGGLALGSVLLFFTLKGIQKEIFLGIYSRINIFFLFLGLSLIVIGLFLKAFRWKLLINETNLSYKNIFYILTIGYLINNLLPARAGEIARIFLMGRREKIGLSKTTGTIAAEKFFDIIVLISMFLFLFLKASKLKDLSLLFFNLTVSNKWLSRYRLFISTFTLFKNKQKLFLVIFLSIIIWLFESLWNFTLMKSLDINLSFSVAIFLASIVNLGLFIPSPPGYIGVFHFLTTFTLVFFGVEKTTAFSYAVLQNFIELIFLSGIGAYSSLKLSFNPLSKKWQKS